MNYAQLYQTIQDYSENYEQTFVYNIPTFVKEAERRIYNSVQLPALRKNVTGTVTTNNKYLSCPSDWLATYSLAVIDTTGRYEYLLNKDVNFLHEAYPNPSVTGKPRYYAIFGPTVNNPNELSFIVTPTPDADYNVELHYFYYPDTIVQGEVQAFSSISGGSGYTNGVYKNVYLTGGNGAGLTATVVIVGQTVVSVNIDSGGNFYTVGDVITVNNTDVGGTGSGFSAVVRTISNTTGTSWIGDNYDPVLFYGAMREAVIFMKGEADMVKYYEDKYNEALQQLIRLGAGLERGDSYRDGQAKLKVNP